MGKADDIKRRREAMIGVEQRVLGAASQAANARFVLVPLKALRPNPNNPRKSFQNIEGLAASIKESGITTPLQVKRVDAEHYEIIAGERRFRAAKQLGLHDIPCILSEARGEVQETVAALVENLQREDLTFLEQLDGLIQLQAQGLTQVAIADKIGKDRSTIANLMRLAPLLTSAVRQAVATSGFRDSSTLVGLGPSRLDEATTLLIVENVQRLPATFRRGLAKLADADEVRQAVSEYLQKPLPAASTEAKHYDRKGVAKLKFGQGSRIVTYQPDKLVSIGIDLTKAKSLEERRVELKRAISDFQALLDHLQNPQEWWELKTDERHKERAHAAGQEQKGKPKTRR